MKILESLLRYKFNLIFISFFLDKYSHFRLLKHLKRIKNECVANPKKIHTYNRTCIKVHYIAVYHSTK